MFRGTWIERLWYYRGHQQYKEQLHQIQTDLGHHNYQKVDLAFDNDEFEPTTPWDLNSLKKWCQRLLNQNQDHLELDDAVEQVSQFVNNQYRVNLVYKLMTKYDFIDPNIINDQGDTFSMLALKCGMIDLVDQMILHPSWNPNIQDQWVGRTLGMIAVRNNMFELAERIINHHDFNPNIQDHQGRTLAMMAVDQYQDYLVLILIAHPMINLNLQTQGRKTLLMMAIEKHRDTVVEQLIEQPVDLKLTDQGSQNVGLYLIKYGYPQYLLKLLDRTSVNKLDLDILQGYVTEILKMITKEPNQLSLEITRQVLEKLNEWVGISDLIDREPPKELFDFFGLGSSWIYNYDALILIRLHAIDDYSLLDEFFEKPCAVCHCDFIEELEGSKINTLIRGGANCQCYYHRDCAIHLVKTIQQSIVKGKPPPDYRPSNCPGCQKRLTPSFLLYCLQQMGFLERGIFQTPAGIVFNLNQMIVSYFQSKNPFVVRCQTANCTGFTLLGLMEEKHDQCQTCRHRQIFRGRDRMCEINRENREAQSLIRNSHGRIRPCPFCGKLIEKNRGCNTMQCGFCQNRFHWNKGKQSEFNHDYDSDHMKYVPDIIAHY